MYKLVVLLFVAAAAAEPGLVFSSPLTYSSVYVPKTVIAKQVSSVLHPSPVVYSPWAYSHFIKKRSAEEKAPVEKRSPGFFFTPTTYAAATPLITSYASAPFLTPIVRSTPLISTPITYSHFIKKRSAPLLTTYVAPTSFSHQSRVDINNAPVLKVTSFPTLHSYPYIF